MPSDRGPRKSRADRALAVDALRRGGEPARDGESMLLPPVDREGMRRKASSAAVECELRLRCGRCRKLCIVDRWRAKVRRARSRASSGTSWRRPSGQKNLGQQQLSFP